MDEEEEPPLGNWAETPIYRVGAAICCFGSDLCGS
jgi:hypothetical protein